MALLQRIVRLARHPPSYIFKRLVSEARTEADQLVGPWISRALSGEALARKAGFGTLDALWDELASRAFPIETGRMDPADLERRAPGFAEAIRAGAEKAVRHEIDLLGSGFVTLGDTIDWHRDFVTGDRWPVAPCRHIDYVNKGRPSDVKRPWELSRLQWLIPAAQAFQLYGDERYAVAAKDILAQWMTANPYARGVNWSCTMEAALRILSWTYLFHVFAKSNAWRDGAFRSRFLACLYLHGRFTEIHIERSSINGNHLTADAAGLVFAGLFFRGIGAADRWASNGWAELCVEIERQVHPDGVDFEASVPYHRLVTELFALPARYRQASSLPVPESYLARLTAMAQFTLAYTRIDGSSPNWGDADDGRALPFGGQSLDDHRYLIGLVGHMTGDQELAAADRSDGSEIIWHFGLKTDVNSDMPLAPQSRAFPSGGVYILRDDRNHVFVDCGPVGLAGLGGHGHNDALSFEAMLNGVALIADPGSYVYTASHQDRNAFRSTAMHNTPQVDGEEINRFYAPDNLWNLHEDANAQCLAFDCDAERSRFAGKHRGYTRLTPPVLVTREITLDHMRSTLVVADDITGDGAHPISIPLHLAAGVEIKIGDHTCFLAACGKRFELSWSGSPGWQLSLEEGRLSPSYGVAVPAKVLIWRNSRALPARLVVTVAPTGEPS
jgi:uncharacterized heparinase superfamily protein